MPYQILECRELINKETLEYMSDKLITTYTEEELLAIEPYVDREILEEISNIREEDIPYQRYLLNVFSDFIQEVEQQEQEGEEEQEQEQEQRPSLLTTIGYIVLAKKAFEIFCGKGKDEAED